MRARPLPLLMLLLAASCGGEDPGESPPSHGLESRPSTGIPRGEPLQVAYALTHGDVFEATLSVHTRVSQRGVMEGRRKDSTLELRATLEITWSIERERPEAAPRSRLELRTVAAEGHRAQEVLARAPIRGTLKHEPDGRPIPASLVLEGGSKAAQVEAQDLLGALLLAGFAGSPSWIPPRPVREHESWELQEWLELRAAAAMQARARELGVDAPRPRISGRVRLLEVRREEQATLLDLELNGLLELSGTLRKDGRKGQLSAGNLYQGLASVDLHTGVPRTLDVQHTNSMRIRSGDDDLLVNASTVVRGTVRRRVEDR